MGSSIRVGSFYVEDVRVRVKVKVRVRVLPLGFRPDMSRTSAPR